MSNTHIRGFTNWLPGIPDTRCKQCIWRAECKRPPKPSSTEWVVFPLVEALPQSPQNTFLCSGNAGIFQRLRDFANRYMGLAPFFFFLSVLTEWICFKNPVNICLGGLERAHFFSGLFVIGIHGFFLAQKLGVFRLQAFDGGQFF